MILKCYDVSGFVWSIFTTIFRIYHGHFLTVDFSWRMDIWEKCGLIQAPPRPLGLMKMVTCREIDNQKPYLKNIYVLPAKVYFFYDSKFMHI